MTDKKEMLMKRKLIWKGTQAEAEKHPLYQRGYEEALKLQEEDFKKKIDECKWERNEDVITNQTATKMVEYSGGINSVIDRHNKSLEELKQKIFMEDKTLKKEGDE